MGKHALLVLGGMLLLVAAGMLLVLRPSTARQLAVYRGAPELQAKEVRSLGQGDHFRLSATVSGSNQPAYRDLVAYEIEEWSAGTGRSGGSWWVTSSHKPPLQLTDLDGDTLTIEGDYIFLSVDHQYEAGTELRYRGVVAGDSVGVHVATGPGGTRLLGQAVTAGDASSFVADQEYGLRVTTWIGYVAAAAGVLLVIAHMRRRRRDGRLTGGDLRDGG